MGNIRKGNLCDISGCKNNAAYEVWYRVHNKSETPARLVIIKVCEECTKHPHLLVNEKVK
jgi:ribosomal protein L33